MSLSNYLLLTNIYLIAFFAFYKLLLDKETYFKLNRVYLLCAGVLSMALPFCRSTWFYNDTVSNSVKTIVSWDMLAQPTAIIPDDKMSLSFTDLLVVCYLLGVVFFLGKFIVDFIKAKKLLSTETPGAAYSFLGKKVIDPALPAANVIALHEDVHIKQFHSFDVLLFELFAIVHWFNPFIYLYKKSLKDIHEFLADEASAESHGDKHEYAVLILSNVLGVEPTVLMHGFFKDSLIKKRIYMLHKNKSKRIALLKYGMFLPIFLLAAVLSSATLNTNKKLIKITEKVDLEKSLEAVNNILPSNPIEDPNSLLKNKKTKSQTIQSGQPNWDAFYNYIAESVRYPSEARKADITGKTQITFVVKDGKVANVSTGKELGYGCDQEVMKAILSYKDFDKSYDGSYSLTTAFTMKGSYDALKEKLPAVAGFTNLTQIIVVADENQPAEEHMLNQVVVVGNSTPIKGEVSNIKINSTQQENKVYDFVSIDKQPEFPGGMEKFYQYLSNSIKYPAEATKLGVQGKVFLTFIVEKNGNLSDIQVVRGPGSGTDEEAIRVLKASPKWYPGVYHGETVRVKYNIAVNFTMTKNLVNQPTKALILVDGKQYYKGLETISPNDIQSINVLKDSAATKLYGEKGKNGVIEITLKMKRLELKKQ